MSILTIACKRSQWTNYMTEDEWLWQDHPSRMMEILIYGGHIVPYYDLTSNLNPILIEKATPQQLINFCEAYLEACGFNKENFTSADVDRANAISQNRIAAVAETLASNENGRSGCYRYLDLQNKPEAILPYLDRRQRASIIRDIIQNPFRPQSVIPVECMRWNDRTVPRIAQGIYESKRYDDFGILYDACLDSGIEDEPILKHLSVGDRMTCRWCNGTGYTGGADPTPLGAACLGCNGEKTLIANHVRGCWAIELLRSGYERNQPNAGQADQRKIHKP